MKKNRNKLLFLRSKLTTIIVSIFLFSSCNTTPVKQVEVKTPLQITDKAVVKPVAITKVVAKMRRGTEIGTLATGWLCLADNKVHWKSGGQVNLSSEELVDVFREELEANGWPVVGSTEDLFTGYDVSEAELLIAAKLSSIETNICYVNAGLGDWTNAKGEMSLDVEWQIYNPARKEIIGEVTTEGSAKLDKSKPDAAYELMNQSFAIAINNLLASPKFIEMSKRSNKLATAPDYESTKTIKNDLIRYQSLQQALDAAIVSTVTVRTAAGHGSGFAIGDGSLVITNSHVVGDAKNVTLVSSGKVELPGKVTMKDKGRDVALIEVKGIRLPSLHIDSKTPKTAEPVYAVGSPLDEELAGSVTNGIVSAIRTFEGYKWIQADVAINPGNSGGPLLNANGHVIGISTAGFQPAGSQVGLNLFIPIQEAVDYLGMTLEDY